MKLSLPFSIPPIEDITDELPHHPTKTWGRRKFNEVENLIVHHMASEAPLENQAKYHIDAHNWPGIAYNLCVDRNRLVQTLDLLTYSTHARGANHNSIGIAVRGDLSKRPMTITERQLLYAGILLVKNIWPDIKVLGHNQVSATACPCTDMDLIRTDVEALSHQVQEQEEFDQTHAATELKAFAAAKRVEALGEHYHSDKWSEAARIKFLWLEDVVELYTPDEIVTRVLQLYKEAQNGRFQGEAVRKLLLLADVMKQRGLL